MKGIKALNRMVFLYFMQSESVIEEILRHKTIEKNLE